MAKRGRYADAIRLLREEARHIERLLLDRQVIPFRRAEERARAKRLRDAARVLRSEQRVAAGSLTSGIAVRARDDYEDMRKNGFGDRIYNITGALLSDEQKRRCLPMDHAFHPDNVRKVAREELTRKIAEEHGILAQLNCDDELSTETAEAIEEVVKAAAERLRREGEQVG